MPPRVSTDAHRDRALARALIAWFQAAQRDLPWRRTDAAGRRDPYASLVSELMLQQTQVARVVDHFAPFLARFPTPADLARADEHEVLAAWSGLGYYRRARALHAAARLIVDRFAGRVPSDPDDLRTLPGVGRYTAGAIASMVFGRPEPIVDGNVARVLLRLDADASLPTDRSTVDRLWHRAGALVQIAGELGHAGAFNEGLMELGATVCTPSSPACTSCPIAKHCAAYKRGLTGTIPTPRPRTASSVLHAATVVVVNTRGQLLVERRGSSGLWASMLQAPTLEDPARAPTPSDLKRTLPLARVRRIGRLDHQTTHRLVRFVVYRGEPIPRARLAVGGRVWRSRRSLAGAELSNAQRRILLELAD